MHEHVIHLESQTIHKGALDIPEIVGKIAEHVGENSQWPRGKDDDLTQFRSVSRLFKVYSDPVFYRRIADGVWNTICVGRYLPRDQMRLGEAAVKYITNSRYDPERIRGNAKKDSVEGHLLRRCVEATFVEWGKNQLASGLMSHLKLKSFRFPGRAYVNIPQTDQELRACLQKWGFSGDAQGEIIVASGTQGEGYEILQGEGSTKVPNPYKEMILPADDPLFQSEILKKMIAAGSRRKSAWVGEEAKDVSQYCTSLTIHASPSPYYVIVPNYKDGDKGCVYARQEKKEEKEAYDLMRQRLQSKDFLHHLCEDRVRNALASPEYSANSEQRMNVEELWNNINLHPDHDRALYNACGNLGQGEEVFDPDSKAHLFLKNGVYTIMQGQWQQWKSWEIREGDEAFEACAQRFRKQKSQDLPDFNALQFPDLSTNSNGSNSSIKEKWDGIKSVAETVFLDHTDALRALMHIARKMPTVTDFLKAMRTDEWENDKGKGGLFKMKEKIQTAIYRDMLGKLSDMQRAEHEELNWPTNLFQQNVPSSGAMPKIMQKMNEFQKNFREQSKQYGSKSMVIQTSDQLYADFFAEKGIQISADDYLTLRKNGANYTISLREDTWPVPESKDKKSLYKACEQCFLRVGEGTAIVKQGERDIKMLEAEYLRSRCVAKAKKHASENNTMFNNLMYDTSQPLRKELQETVFKSLFSDQGISMIGPLVELIKSYPWETEAKRKAMYRNLCSFVNKHLEVICSRNATSPEEVIGEIKSFKKDEWEDPSCLLNAGFSTPQPMDIDSSDVHDQNVSKTSHPDMWKLEIQPSDTEFYNFLAGQGFEVNREAPVNIYDGNLECLVSQNGVVHKIDYLKNPTQHEACVARTVHQGVAGQWRENISSRRHVQVRSAPSTTIKALSSISR